MQEVRKEFAQWASKRLGGTDGGNPIAPLGVWVCGMEFRDASGKCPRTDDGFARYALDDEFTEMPYLPADGTRNLRGYDKRVAKLIACLKTGSVAHWEANAVSTDIVILPWSAVIPGLPVTGS